VLYVAETAAPEDALSISAIERGNLLHKALELFIDKMPDRKSPAEPWTDAERAELLKIGEELCDEAEAAGLTGKAIMWRLARSRIRRDLEGFLDADEKLRLEHGVVPEDVEVSFGMSGEAPLIVDLGDRAIAFRGRIDRVDRSPDGSRLLVLDYKTGGVLDAHRKLDADPVHGGTLLQLPVYALAARERYGAKEVEAHYWFATEQRNYSVHGYDVGDWQLEKFRAALATIGSGIGQGLFPARPGKRGRDDGFENCMFCPYDRACPGDRARVWNRKRSAPQLNDYIALAESNE
jgi:ATP-dependent helicase/DNAse subunit B